jgi:signal peptidase II
VGFLIPAAVVIAVDQLTKQLFWHTFLTGQSVDILPGILRITLVRNAGAAFGMLQGARPIFIFTSVLAAIVILYLGWRLPRSERYRRFLLSLILGGAVGNLIDRVYAGEVIDFVEMGVNGHWWPVYNMADVAVTIGAVLLFVELMREKRGIEPGIAGAHGGAGDDGVKEKEPANPSDRLE